jgi:hypothetical protein
VFVWVVRILYWTVIAVVLTSLLIGGVPSASGQTLTDTTYTVALEAKGNATVTLTYVFNLETSAEAAAFDQLEADTTVRTRLADEFQAQMEGVAGRTASQTSRLMTVQNAAVSFNRTESIGLVHVQIKWLNLASVTDNGHLTLSEPFGSSFTPDGVFRVTVPTGHTISSMSPNPIQQTTMTATWNADAILSGFKLVAAPTDVDSDDADTFVSAPTSAIDYTALAPALALIALCLIVIIFVVRRR